MPRTVLLLALLAATMTCNSPRHPTRLFLVGDSTMADKPRPGTNPMRGWGQMLQPFFDETVDVRNHAVNGRSTKSFIDEGRWQAVLDDLRPGDYVFIQFGHNDQKDQDPKRFTNPWTGYRANLERFVTETREKGGLPVLLTSIVRRRFNEHGVFLDTHRDYPVATRAVAEAMDVPLIDMQRLTEALVVETGVEESKSLYCWVAPGVSEEYPEGLEDNSHLSIAGGEAFARLVAEDLGRQGHPLADRLASAR